MVKESPKTLYIDCTFIYSEDPQSGIQRVVRNILNYGLGLQTELGITIQTVIWDKGYFVPVSWPSSYQRHSSSRLSLKSAIKKLFKPVLTLVLPPNWHQPVFRFYRELAHLRRLAHRRQENPPQFVEFAAGDTLMLLDSSWHIPYWREVQAASQAGAKVGFLIHDLVPYQHPEFCDIGIIISFRGWLEKALQVADFAVANSQTTKAYFEEHLKQHKIMRPIKSGWFKLGANLEHSSQSHPSVVVKDLIRGDFDYYLLVGTIEPRKNQGLAIEAFDTIWKQYPDLRLVIVGKIGWHIQSLITRIQNHPHYGERLIMINRANDTDLGLLYRHTKALIIPSVQEGFGLPVVEALSYQCPVLASDIPALREVGGKYTAYFKPDSVSDLVSLIRRFEQTGKFPATPLPRKFKWPNWQQSTHEFYRQVIKLSK